MFSYEIRKNDGLIVLTTVGETTYDDYQAVAPKFFADVELHKINKILLDNRQFAGWASKEAESLSFTAWAQSRSVFEHVALVVLDNSKSEVTRFLEFFRNTGKDVRVFPPSQYDAALEWLKKTGNMDE